MLDDTHANRAAMEELVADLRSRMESVKKGGGELAVKRHKERGKMFVRERIEHMAALRDMQDYAISLKGFRVQGSGFSEE